MGNISTHQNISRNIISDSTLILMSNYLESTLVLYLSIWFKCFTFKESTDSFSFLFSLWQTPRSSKQVYSKGYARGLRTNTTWWKGLSWGLVVNTPLYRGGIIGQNQWLTCQINLMTYNPPMKYQLWILRWKIQRMIRG